MIVSKKHDLTFDFNTLNESFESIYPSQREISLTKRITNDIIALNKLSFDEYTHLIKENGEVILYTFRLRYENISLPFIDNLNVYVGWNTENTSMVLDNVAAYVFDEKRDKFIRKPCELEIIDKRTEVPEIIQNIGKRKYNEGSVLFLFENKCSYNQRHLMFVIRHEFVHMKYILEKNQTTEEQNIEKILSDGANNLKKYTTPLSLKLFEYLQSFAGHINKSELNAYVSSTMDELADTPVTVLTRYLDKDDDVIIKFMTKNSETFKMYTELKSELSRSKIFMNTIDKENFAKIFIRRIFGAKGNNYNTDFKDNGKYTEKSFDKFIDAVCSDIQENYIDNCIRYFKRCQAIIEHEIMRYTRFCSCYNPPGKKRFYDYSLNECLDLYNRKTIFAI